MGFDCFSKKLIKCYVMVKKIKDTDEQVVLPTSPRNEEIKYIKI